MELASGSELQKVLRTHLNIKSPEKCFDTENALAPETGNKPETTKVNETLEEMFADQESGEEEIGKPTEDIEQLNAELNIREGEGVVKAVVEEGARKEEEVGDVNIESEGSEQIEQSVDEVEEIATDIVGNMEGVESQIEVKEEEDKMTIACAVESKAVAVSPDSNKENLGSSSLDSDLQEKGEEDKDKSPSMMPAGIRKLKNPFTELRRSSSSSRAAKLVSVYVAASPTFHQCQSGVTGNSTAAKLGCCVLYQSASSQPKGEIYSW